MGFIAIIGVKAMDKTGDTGDKFGLHNIDTRPAPLGLCSLLINGDMQQQYKQLVN